MRIRIRNLTFVALAVAIVAVDTALAGPTPAPPPSAASLAAAVQPAAKEPASAAASAKDWPQWRGPDRNGIVPPGGPAIADKWPQGGPAKLWQSERVESGDPPAAGAGLGSPVVAGGRVYLYANSGQDVFYCFDAATGKTLWKKTFAAPKVGASGTICVDGDRLYQVGGGGTAYCLNAKTGDEIWKTPGLGGYKCSSFLVAEGKAVVLGEVLTALNADTGQVVWKQEQIKSGNEGANSPALWKSGGKAYVIQNSLERGVFCVDLTDGRVVWKADGGSNSTACIEGDRMVLGVNDKIIAYRLSASGAEKLWTAQRGGDRASSPILYKDHVYTVAGGRAQCVELRTGKVLWDGSPGGGEISSPIFVNDKLVALWDNGNSLVLIRATPERYELLGKVGGIPGAQCTSPAVTDGKLYVRLRDAVACYDLVNPVPAAKPEKK